LVSVKNAILLAMATLMSAVTLLLARLWFQRAALPYNAEGRYFDAAHSVVYDQGAVGVYAILAALFALAAAATLLWAFRARRR
jgi:hypothetical protein